MRFANYGRKSVFSDKSDSIDNQFRMSRDYCEAKFAGQIESWEQYSDEDFSGANTDRPDLKRLMQDIKDGLVDALVVYQLDRLSRDVRDFANIYAILEEHRVTFISIKESIDTATPIGKAMMYVTVVFAQMERETIAARVTDNMIGLAKKGLWVGGKPPVGYRREQIVLNGRKHVTIVPVPEEAKYVTDLYDTFLDNNYSLQGMETAFRQQGIKTRSGYFFSTGQLHGILTMPYCVEAVPEVYDYYAAKGCQMDDKREEWDGSHGVMVYGRGSEKSGKRLLQPCEAWHVCVGQHKPFMKADKWLAVQAKFGVNKFNKTMKYPVPLLKGVLRCSCGSSMQIARKKRKVGVLSEYYCLRRMRQGKEACDRHMLPCEVIDNKVLAVFKEIGADQKAIMKYVRQEENDSQEEPQKDYKREIARYEAQIGRLAASLALSEESSAAKYIIAEMERLDANLAALKREQAMAQSDARKRSAETKNAEQKAAEIADFIGNLENFTDVERNRIMRQTIKECVWDGETLFLKL